MLVGAGGLVGAAQVVAAATPIAEVGGQSAAAAASVAFTIADDRISESSGLAMSRRHRDVVYTHNDSEDDARVFALGTNGTTRAVLTLEGVQARDWEAIATGEDDEGRPAVFIGDIGDNLGGAWSEIWVYRIGEPRRLEDQTVSSVRYRFRYADGPRDAEAMLVDPGTNRIYIVSKGARGGAVYAAPTNLSTSKVNVLRRVAEAPAMITDGAFAPDGSRLALRDYVFAHVYNEAGSRIARLTLPIQSQGESVTYSRDGRSLLSGSEGPNAKVWRVPLPRVALSTPLRSTRAAPLAEDRADTGDLLVFGGNLLAVLFAAGTAYLLLGAMRRRRKPGSR
ncbi:MAG: hypothetical protein L0Y54_05070 [Sporichthyaceae bacterium]|nr:hypothetical protein [Sporichthyaceae bacterium]